MPLWIPILAIELPKDPQTYALAIAVIATGYVYMKARKNAPKNPFKGEPLGTRLATQKRVENTMTDLILDLEKMARQITAQLDTRTAKLDELIRQADERIAELKRLEGSSLPLPPSSLTPHRQTPPLRSPSFTATEYPDLDATGDRGRPDDGFQDAPASIPIDPRHATVYRLADEGLSSVAIAREIGQPAGEVELILALRRRAR